MGEDISTGAKIAISLIILVSLIGIVFSLLTLMKNVTNTASGSLQNGLDQILQSQYSSYDQQIRTGQEIISALKVFEGQEVAIITVTTKGVAEGYAGGFLYGRRLNGYTKGASLFETGIDVFYSNTFSLTSDNPSGAASYYIGSLWEEDNELYNLVTSPVNKSGTAPYIRASGKYMSYLVRDASNTIIGLLFIQKN